MSLPWALKSDPVTKEFHAGIHTNQIDVLLLCPNSDLVFLFCSEGAYDPFLPNDFL